MFITHPNLSGLYEVIVFDGGFQSSRDLSIDIMNVQNSSTVRYALGTTFISVGDLFVRAVAQNEEGGYEGVGTFTWFGGPGQLTGAIVQEPQPAIVNELKSLMVSPVGTPIFVDGQRVQFRDDGTQDLWTGVEV